MTATKTSPKTKKMTKDEQSRVDNHAVFSALANKVTDIETDLNALFESGHIDDIADFHRATGTVSKAKGVIRGFVLPMTDLQVVNKAHQDNMDALTEIVDLAFERNDLVTVQLVKKSTKAFQTMFEELAK